jgi:hypothetical protein
VVQSVQTRDNAVLLVAGKRTVARVFVTREKIDHVDPPKVGATLEAYRNGVSLGTVPPMNPGGLFAITGESLEVRLEDSINFELPAGWTAAGPVRLRAIVDPAQAFVENNRANNVVEREITFVPSKTLRLRFVRYSYLRQGQRIEPEQRQIDELVSVVKRMFPVANVDAATTHVIVNCSPEPSCNSTFTGSSYPTNTPWREDVRAAVLKVRQSAEPTNPDALYVGIYAMPPDVLDLTARGSTWWRDRVATVYVFAGVNEPQDSRDWLPRAGAHEIGHLLGRGHVRCNGEEENPVPDFPSAAGTIGGYPTNALGLDVGDVVFGSEHALRIIPGSTGDLMSYCAPGWVSPFTYEGIHRYIQTTRGVATEGP